MKKDFTLAIFPFFLIRGMFFIVLVSSIMMIPPVAFHQGEIEPIFKGPRPYMELAEYPLTPLKDHKPKREEQLYQHIIFEAADQYRVDPAMIKAIIMAESGYNPYAVSTKGAVGLMQLMPATATELGVEDSLDPVHNINGGVRYFRKLMNIFEDDVLLALSAYNAGIERVKEYDGIPPFQATRYYIIKVLQYYHYYKDSFDEKESSAA